MIVRQIAMGRTNLVVDWNQFPLQYQREQFLERALFRPLSWPKF